MTAPRLWYVVLAVWLFFVVVSIILLYTIARVFI